MTGNDDDDYQPAVAAMMTNDSLLSPSQIKCQDTQQLVQQLRKQAYQRREISTKIFLNSVVTWFQSKFYLSAFLHTPSLISAQDWTWTGINEKKWTIDYGTFKQLRPSLLIKMFTQSRLEE